MARLVLVICFMTTGVLLCKGDTIVLTSTDERFNGTERCFNGGTENKMCEDATTVKFTCTCPAGYLADDCSVTDHCYGGPCQNGGTCNNELTDYNCTCPTDYYGKDCEINYCLSGPCQNGAICQSHPDNYTCVCMYGFYGRDCEQGICDPTKAEVIFLLDSSISMTEEMFNKQKEFVNSFIDHVTIGPDNFLIGIITFSTHAKVQIHLNAFASNDTLKQAVQGVSFTPGATFTNKGLALVRAMVQESRFSNRNMTRFLVIVTDGMSTDRSATKSEAMEIKTNRLVDKVVSIGVGPQVSHQELMDMASDPDTFTPSYVFSVQNFNALYTIIKELVHITCQDYIVSSMSEIVLLVDTGPFSNFQQNRISVSNFISRLNVEQEVNGTHARLVTFADSPDKIAMGNEMRTASDKGGVLIKLSMARPATGLRSQIGPALMYVEDEIFKRQPPERQSARKFIVVCSNGNFSDADNPEIQQFLNTTAASDITVFAIGTGQSVLMDNLLRIVNDPYNVLVSRNGEDETANLILYPFFTYNTEGSV